MRLRIVATISFLFVFIHLFAQQKVNEKIVSVSFDNVLLEKALQQINRQYKVPVAFDNIETRKYTITAHIDAAPVSEVLKQLVANTGLEIVKIQQVYVVKPKEKKKENVELINISSKVEDYASREPLPYALISVMGTKTFAISNTRGAFSLINIPDTALFHVSYLGYKDTIVNIEVIQSAVRMKPDPSLLKEIIVKDQGSTTIEYGEETSKVSFNPNAIDRLPVLGDNDVFRALQLLPGISGTNETSSGLVIRGNSPDKNLVLLDGYSLYHIDHFYGIYSSFNSKAIKNIQLYKGGFNAQYGGRASSVMVLTAKDGNRSKFSGDIGINFVDFNAVFEMPINKKLTFIAAGRRSLTDVVENYLFKELFDKAVVNSGDLNNVSTLNYKDLSPKFNFGDLNLKMTYRASKKDQYAISFYTSSDNLKYSYEQAIENVVDYTTSERSSWGNVGMSGIWSRQWGKKLDTQAYIAYSTYYSNTTLTDTYVYNDSLGIADEEYIQAQDNNVSDFTIKVDNQYKTSSNSVLKFGITNTYNTIRLVSILDEEEFPLFSQNGNQFQLYSEYGLFITPKIETNLGIRVNYFDLKRKFYIEPKISLTYEMLPWLGLKSSWAINNQMISRILRLDLFTSNPDFWVLSGNEVPVMNSNHIAAGVHLNFPILTIDFEAFAISTQNEVEYLPVLRNYDTNENNIEQLYAIGDSETRGLELLLEKGFGNYSGWISYTLSNSLNYFKDLNGGKPFPSRYDQRHEFKLVNMFNYGKWNWSVVWIYGTGKPYSAPEGSYSISTPDGSSINNVAYSRINNERLPDYHRLDLSATYNFNLGVTKAKVGLSVFNVYNRKNIKYRRYSKVTFDENGNILSDDRYIVTDIRLLGITPSIFFNWSF